MPFLPVESKTFITECHQGNTGTFARQKDSLIALSYHSQDSTWAVKSCRLPGWSCGLAISDCAFLPWHYMLQLIHLRGV